MNKEVKFIDVDSLPVAETMKDDDRIVVYNKTDGMRQAPAKDYTAKGYTDNAVAGVKGEAPIDLDTLAKLAAAINNDPNYKTTIADALGQKADSSGVYTKTDWVFGDGYIKMPGGVLVCWGWIEIGWNNDRGTITLPHAFANTIYSVVLGVGNDPNVGAGLNAISLGVQNRFEGSFGWENWTISNYAVRTAPYDVTYIAIGKYED